MILFLPFCTPIVSTHCTFTDRIDTNAEAAQFVDASPDILVVALHPKAQLIQSAPLGQETVSCYRSGHPLTPYYLICLLWLLSGRLTLSEYAQMGDWSHRWKELFHVKYGALALLVLQNTFLVVLMGYSRTRTTDKLYASSTAVAVMEVTKFICCLFVIAMEKGSLISFAKSLRDELVLQPLELAKLAVPSVLYSVQNNLLYYALSHLDAATFQVGYQVKILTTALFSVFMLNKSLSGKQWGALLILTIGVSLAQLSASHSTATHRNTTGGFIAVLSAAITSGFSGVYFERILKNSGTSLWMRNLQMGVSSIVSGFLGIYFSGELPQVQANGFFYGYNGLVVTVILLQAVGGLIVAVVVKYADNILKGFAASFSIITSCLLSIIFFDFRPNLEFLVGAALVNWSMYLYSQVPVSKEIKFDTATSSRHSDGADSKVSGKTTSSDSNV